MPSPLSDMEQYELMRTRIYTPDSMMQPIAPAVEDMKQGPEHPATDQDVAAAHKLSARVEEVERPQPKNEPPLMIKDEDRAEACVIGYLGPQTLLLELLAAHRRMKREAYALLAQKDSELARIDELYQKVLTSVAEKERDVAQLTFALTNSESAFSREKELREKAEADRNSVRDVLRESAWLHGSLHDNRCPEDDTCNCSMKDFNSRVNAACGEIVPDDLTFMTRAKAAEEALSHYPAKWREDSSLDTWFPITAEILSTLRAELSKANASLAALKALMEMVDGIDETGHEPCPRWRVTRQNRIGKWAQDEFGEAEALHLPQRGVRHMEEANEAGQAAGVTREMAHKLVDHVWDRPVGNLAQELGGVAVTLLALAHAAKLNAEECEVREIERILNKPAGYFTKRNAAKNDAGLLAALPSPPTTEAATEAIKP